jgi:anti-sigma B factor antagonist
MEFYYHDVDGDILILSADGGLIAATADQFVDELDQIIQCGCQKLIVDCTRLTYISSYGLGLLVRLHKKLAVRGGNVKLAAVEGAIPKLLSLTQLDRVFEIYPTVDEARRAFRKGAGPIAE